MWGSVRAAEGDSMVVALVCCTDTTGQSDQEWMSIGLWSHV